MLRGIFDGGGLRKQNGHWQSSGAGVVPPSPEIMLSETILYIGGGNRLYNDGGIINHLNFSAPYSIVPHNGKPFFYPHDQARGWEMDMFDPAINTGGDIYNSDWGDINPHATFGGHLRYVNGVIYYSGGFGYDDTQAPCIAFNDYISEHGSATLYVRIKPNSNDTSDMQEAERNLCLGDNNNVRGFYSPVGGSYFSFTGGKTDGDTEYIIKQNIVGNPDPIKLNLTNEPIRTGQTPPTPEYMYGFKVGDGITFEGLPITTHQSWLYFNLWETYFSFPFDYDNFDKYFPFLSLKVEVFYK